VPAQWFRVGFIGGVGRRAVNCVRGMIVTI
jgi:hypothetical protein